MHDTGHKTDINTRLIRLVDIFVLNTKSSSCGIHYLIALNQIKCAKPAAHFNRLIKNNVTVNDEIDYIRMIG